ncbi:hypothetical protein SAMN05421830_101764 [Desulfomicrobium norvegicum]|uniref:Uncharacterized protein n=1 Tax=Desulfomicrobium norvegicum (strain DSM 1741 / NCIMB 8310) TaxID=52561 RepID=A0A8G2FD46_DESNO|nr:hypothetical protein [Desulfomicrobium norvegicum]SFL35681.1 hypothetical protein SAMN05421830_101764 [Desulfomicrobium norvegicum]
MDHPFTNNEMPQHAQTGHFWPEPKSSDFLRVVEFAGFQVPEDGLVLAPPYGGELTVWPDGQYSFVCPVSGDGGQSMVATYYSYIAEAVDGTTTLGSFALGEKTPEETMPDFQGWSLDDILALDDVVGLSVDGLGSVLELSGLDAGTHVGVDLDLSLDAVGFSVDVLEHVIKTSYES